VLWLYPGTNGRQTKRIDWLGLGLLAFFMVMLISGLHTLANIRSAPLTTIVPLAVPTGHVLGRKVPCSHSKIPCSYEENSLFL
jgi:hypothetical protein